MSKYKIFYIFLQKKKKQKQQFDENEIIKSGKNILSYLRSKGKANSADLIEKLFEDDALAKRLKNYLDGKANPEDVISPEAATALRTYLHYTKSSYSDLKRYTDNIGRPFLPPYHTVTEEIKKCLPDEEQLKFSDDEVVATIKGTLDKHMERTLEDPDTEAIMAGMVEEHGEENVKFELKDKIGHDGTTIDTTKVSI